MSLDVGAESALQFDVVLLAPLQYGGASPVRLNLVPVVQQVVLLEQITEAPVCTGTPEEIVNVLDGGGQALLNKLEHEIPPQV